MSNRPRDYVKPCKRSLFLTGVSILVVLAVVFLS
jgi:hypothetical protein